MRTAIAVIGPTATGKTKLGVLLAQQLGGEVISVDSLQCYEQGQIITACPTDEEIGDVPHHMIRCMGPLEEPENYPSRVVSLLYEISARGKTPILVGGSMSLTVPVLEAVIAQDYRLGAIILAPDVGHTDYRKRVQTRADEMVESGLLNELRDLYKLAQTLDVSLEQPRGVFKAIGLKEFEPFFQWEEAYGVPGCDDNVGRSLLKAAGAALTVKTLWYARCQTQCITNELLPILKDHGVRVTKLSVPEDKAEWHQKVGKRGMDAARAFVMSLNTPSPSPSPPPEDVDMDGMLKPDTNFCFTPGIMGAVAGELVRLSGPDSVHGIIPQALADYEARIIEETGLSIDFYKYGRRTIVRDMHTRKAMMHAAVRDGGPGSGFVALSGGFGTIEEVLEAVTWRQLCIHDRPVCVYDVDGIYTGLLAWLKQTVHAGFISEQDAGLLDVARNSGEVINKLLDETSTQRASPHGLVWK
ncbi:Bifunctional cytokinin biosynthesis protein [Fusarium austroafricanum]|uniref:Bifunctional cytokinin biosynthesis protein n=1 Tax=Fusarium austroafricanum TaxID=2364996 RepID=A0A8H4KAW0_9HYPO|nr:Bifunctional cytokinin biosynthesis protein [Fusarium austroafricanum]